MLSDQFTKSSASLTNCVAARVEDDGEVRIARWQRPEGASLTFTPDEWRAFVIGVKRGEFDYPTAG